MSSTEPLCQILGINPNQTKNEALILEAELFIGVYEGIKEIIKAKYKDFFRLMKFDTKMENAMIETDFIRYVINDILSTGDYSLEGIAYYTSSSEDVIWEIACGNNTNPSLMLSRKIIELHRLVRPSLYREMIEKMVISQLNFAIQSNSNSKEIVSSPILAV